MDGDRHHGAGGDLVSRTETRHILPAFGNEWPLGAGLGSRLENMRTLLEFLGIVEPDRSRREPVALPAWSRWVLPLLVPALALVSTGLYLAVRTLFA